MEELGLSTNGGPLVLTPAFQPDVLEYSATTEKDRVTINFKSKHPAAQVAINGKTTAGKGEYEASLTEGDNVFEILSKAENGTTVIYRLTVTRKSSVSSPEPIAETKSYFRDIKGHWAESDINAAFLLGIVQGDESGNFKPDADVSRAEWIVMLQRLLKASTPKSLPDFTDKAAIPAWANDAIATAVAQGIVNGYADGSFQPAKSISRAEIAAMLVRAMKWPTGNNAHVSYADAGTIPEWAKPYVQAASKHGIMNGLDGNRFGPDEPATRAQAAVLLVRLSKLLNGNENTAK